MMENHALVRIENVSTGYENKVILNDISLTIHKNDFIGVIGPNGGGKTTLIRLILKQIEPFSGTIGYKEGLEKKIGYLPQINNVDKDFPISVEEVILSGLQSSKGLFGKYGHKEKEKVYRIMQECGIEHIARKSIGEISGGQLQRTFLSRALISEPELLILDEPNTYVDNKFEKELYELLKSLNKDMAILMVTHDLGTISSYVKSIACVNRSLYYHESNIISQEQLNSYDCPILLVTHGEVPHTVLNHHKT